MFGGSGLFHQMWNLHIEDTLELNTLLYRGLETQFVLI